jgi:dTDP-4-dehydrorhamnose reductase
MRILVIGRTGQLARALETAGSDQQQIRFLGRDAADLMLPGQAAQAIITDRPDLIINAAAYTAVDDAEDNWETAFRINGAAVGEIATAAAAVNAALIHISTDYVFDGTKAGAYVETDPINPANTYGASKRAGEIAALEGNQRTVVLRTSWVYSPWGKNFILTTLRLSNEHSQLRIVDDQIGNPTSALDLADACQTIATRLVQVPTDSPLWGLYHYTGCGTCSWADFAAELFKQSARRGGRIPEIDRISTADYPTNASRPANSALDCASFESTFALKTVPWQTGLARALDVVFGSKGT